MLIFFTVISFERCVCDAMFIRDRFAAIKTDPSDPLTSSGCIAVMSILQAGVHLYVRLLCIDFDRYVRPVSGLVLPSIFQTLYGLGRVHGKDYNKATE